MYKTPASLWIIMSAVIILNCSPSRQLDTFMNTKVNVPSYDVSISTRVLHESLVIVDMHSDALLWERDLLEKNSMGHVDIPRLIEGNVAIQAFTIVSNVPLTLNNGCNTAHPDIFCCLSFLQGWPGSAWFSSKERAMLQISRLKEAEKRSGGRFTIILSRSDIDMYLERRKTDSGITAGFIGLEGAYPLDGEADSVNILFDAGVRMISLTHFPDSEMGGSQHGFMKGGLTDEGVKLIKTMNSKGILIDLSHSSRDAIKEILSITDKPVVFSHTGVKGVCDNNRNITDDEIRSIAQNGGVIGVGFFGKATCGDDISAVVDSIEYVIKIAGVDHVALGSDFDGFVTTPVDSSGMIYITDELIRRKHTPEDITKIMGGNTLRVMRQVLPAR